MTRARKLSQSLMTNRKRKCGNWQVLRSPGQSKSRIEAANRRRTRGQQSGPFPNCELNHSITQWNRSSHSFFMVHFTVRFTVWVLVKRIRTDYKLRYKEPG